MGVELQLVALPPTLGLVEAARRDRDRGDNLAMLPGWMRHPDPYDAGTWGDDPFYQAARRLAAEYPARVLDLDRTYDFLHWLLSPARRGEPDASPTAVDHLFDAGEAVAEHVRAVQGWPVRHVSPAVVRAAADALDRATLPAGFDPAAAEAACVYKFFAGRDDAGWLATAGQQLGELRAFVTAAAGRGDELIVVVD